MTHTITNAEDLRWLIGHTGGFRGGYVTDVQMSKRRLFDEETGRDVLAGLVFRWLSGISCARWFAWRDWP